MNYTGQSADLFLAANSPLGFVSYFDELRDPERLRHLLIIKGGPGCGKSTLMKQLAENRETKEPVQRLHCSADPGSLDGVLFENSKIAIVDGTAPHVVEPVYPGAFEHVIDLYQCLEENFLEQHQTEILEAHRKNKQLLTRCHGFIAAAGALVGEICQIAAPYTDSEKISRYAKSLAKRLIPEKKAKRGLESSRFLTCLGGGEKNLFWESIPALCDKTIVLHDRWGAAGRILLNDLKARFLAAGYDVMVCPCPLSPHHKPEHLFIPELRLGFLTSNDFHPLDLPNAKNIHARRFTDMERLEEKTARIKSHIKAAKSLLTQTDTLMREAKQWHDVLEKYYVKACDFSKIDQIRKELLKKYF